MKRPLLVLAAVAVLGPSSSISADVIYYQPVLDDNGHNPFRTVFGYEDFSTSGAYIVETVSITAFHSNRDADNIPDLDWEIRAGGATPGALLHSGNALQLSKTFDIGHKYTYVFDVADFSLAAGSYWFGAHTSTSDDVHWAINTSAAIGATALKEVSPGSGSYVNYFNDSSTLEFGLVGTPIPEPTALVLTALGLLSMCCRRRRRV